MRAFSLKRVLALLCLCFLCAPARAQLSVTSTATSSTINVNETVTFNITVQNPTAIEADNAVIQSRFPTTAVIVSETTSSPSALVTSQVTTNAGAVNVALSGIPGSSAATISIALRPTRAGAFTNTIVVAAEGFVAVTNKLVVTVNGLNADLTLTFAGVPTTAIANDWATYSATVTNRGPETANGVTVTSTLPTNVTLIAVSPAGHHTLVNRSLVLNMGTLTNGQSSQFLVTVQLGAVGTNAFVNTVQSTDTNDPSSANNTTTTTVIVAPYVPQNIRIVALSDFVYDQNVSLFNQVVTIQNVSTSALANIHLIVTNLTVTNKLWVISGTNAAHPFLMLTNILIPGETQDVNMQFFFAKRQPVSVDYVAAGIVTKIVLTNTFSVATNGTLAFRLNSISNRNYSVIYGTNVTDLIAPATNAVRTTAVVATNGTLTLVAPAPPLPEGTNTTSTRFFQVIQNP